MIPNEKATGVPQETVATARLDGAAATRAVGELRLIYAEVFAEPPHHETADDVAAAFLRFTTQAARPAFRAALARTGDGEPVGMAYGWPLPADTPWWDEFTEPVSEDMRREDGRRTFGLMELAVRRAWRGRGIARRLHESLLDGLEAERVMLNVDPENGAAAAAYTAWGYRAIGQARPAAAGAELRNVMLLNLR
nr:GNAT family N-acetyltransferase [Streptomyces sp. SBE_14.2]